MRRQLKAVFPPVPLGAAEVLADSREIWERLLADLATARHEIQIENYILVDGDATDALLDALGAAAAAGARIRIQVDGAGSYQMSGRLRQRLEALGELRVYHPLDLRVLFGSLRERLLRRTHRRLVTVDGRIGWTGGLAFEDPWWPDGQRVPVRETMIRLEGAAVAQLREAFLQLWEARLPAPVHVRDPRAGEVLVSPHYARRRHRPAQHLRSLLDGARQRVWLGTAYFVPPRPFRRLLYRAAERGIEVRLLLPGATGHDHPIVRSAGRRYYGRLLAKGVRIYEYLPTFYHAKCALVDDSEVMVGTWNLDRWSFLSNHEIAVFAHDPRCAAALEAQFVRDFRSCREITVKAWRERPWYDRVLERFSGLFDRWL